MLHAGIFGGLVCGTYSEDLAGFWMTDGAKFGGYALGGTMAVRFGYCIMYVWPCFTTAGVEMRFRGVLCW